MNAIASAIPWPSANCHSITVRQRIHVLPKREGNRLDHKKLFRLSREEKLTMTKRSDQKRAILPRAPMLVPMAASDRWTLCQINSAIAAGFGS
jgi:putative transposase